MSNPNSITFERPEGAWFTLSSYCLSVYSWNSQLNGGGLSLVQANTPGGSWPAFESSASSVRTNLCGAQAGSTLMSTPGDVVMTYEGGKTALFRVSVPDSTPGHFEFRICNGTGHCRREDNRSSSRG
jgi:hypothetical protein